MFIGRKEYLDAFLSDGNWEEKYLGRPLALEPYMRREWDNLGI